ncbi:hypothetical protein EVAR_29516_1 [Eumeta japonica]|uniref:Uncharacterized protein n=1 Tax=Eumeta variegata TaxID=151549 RepID=A0A4C1WFN7_EUMVA|nr:hypothetical protein EVAR_29516_1 [Eumeta japonica]
MDPRQNRRDLIRFRTDDVRRLGLIEGIGRAGPLSAKRARAPRLTETLLLGGEAARSSEVTFPCSMMWLAELSVRMSQKRIRLSEWPEMIVDPAPSEVTKSLQEEPANFVSVPVA